MHLRFAEFEFESESGQLWRHGVRVPIQEKPFCVLAMLLDAPGKLVTRKEIADQIWADTHVLEDLSLNTAMRKIRLALNDSPASPRFIETVGRRGYRFIHPVQNVPTKGLGAHTITLAVLPLDNLGGGTDEHFSDGITEELITELGRLRPRFSVIALDSVMRYKRSEADLSKILRDLGADFVLSGSIRRFEQRVRISTRLISGADRTCVWSDTFDSNVSDVFAVQKEVAANVARSTARVLFNSNYHEPRSLAHEIYLRGRFFWNKRNAPSLLKSVELFNHALTQDSDYVLAYVGVADSYSMLAQHGVIPGAQVYPIAKEAAQKALALDPDCAEAHVSMSWVKAVYEHDFRGAESECNIAIQLNPNYSFAYMSYAYLLTALGRHHQSLELMRRGLHLDPVSLPMNSIYAALLYFARQYEAAIDQCKECLELDPTFSMSYAIYGQALEALHHSGEAIQKLERNAELAPWNSYVLAHLARIYAVHGLVDKTHEYLDKIFTASETKYVPSYFIALVYAALSDRDTAFEWLTRAEHECSNWALFAAVDPKVDPLRTDPRLITHLRNVGLDAGASFKPDVGLSGVSTAE